MGVATFYINIFIARVLDHACTALFIHTLYTDVVLYAQQKTSDRDGIPAAVGCLIFHQRLAKNIGYEQLQCPQFRERCSAGPTEDFFDPLEDASKMQTSVIKSSSSGWHYEFHCLTTDETDELGKKLP